MKRALKKYLKENFDKIEPDKKRLGIWLFKRGKTVYLDSSVYEGHEELEYSENGEPTGRKFYVPPVPTRIIKKAIEKIFK